MHDPRREGRWVGGWVGGRGGEKSLTNKTIANFIGLAYLGEGNEVGSATLLLGDNICTIGWSELAFTRK